VICRIATCADDDACVSGNADARTGAPFGYPLSAAEAAALGAQQRVFVWLCGKRHAYATLATRRALRADVLTKIGLPAGSTLLHALARLDISYAPAVAALLRTVGGAAMTECKDADGNTPRAVASLALAPLLDAEQLAALTLLATSAAGALAPGAWLKLLRDGGGALDAQDVRGVSPLIAAAVVGDVKSIEALLAGGVAVPPGECRVDAVCDVW
jgi:hypothetical protein